MNQTQAEQCPGSRREWVKKNGTMTCQGCTQTWDLWRETEPREDSGQTIPWHGRKIVPGATDKPKPAQKAKSPFDGTVFEGLPALPYDGPSPYTGIIDRVQASIDRVYPQRFVMGINIDEVVSDRLTASRVEGARPTFTFVDETITYGPASSAQFFGTVPTVPFTQDEVTGRGYARQSFTTTTTAAAGPFPSRVRPHPADCPVCNGRNA